uniref:Apple domain-containing protein n=1 Tax=Biomphalaria glabrata TaxID=6526 RepID=A0A2C9LXF9_BIOGL
MELQLADTFSWLVVVLIISSFPDVVRSNTLITRPGASSTQCAQACLDEREIDCRFYKFDKVKETCILSAMPDPTVTNMKQLEKPDVGPIKNAASSWIEQLQARLLALEQKNIDIKNLHKETAELRAEVAALKNSRALTHHLLRTTKEQTDQNIAAEDEKTEVLKAETKRVEDAIMTLGELQKTFSEKVKKINEAEKATDLKVAMLSQSAKDNRASVRELGTEESDLKNGLMNVKRVEAELEVRFAGLSADVMEKVASIDSMVGPELKEMRDSQATLAEALSLLTKKIMTLAPRIPALQKQINKKEGILAVVSKKMQSFDSQIDFLNERLRFSEKQLRKVIDPGSKLNVENRRVMTYLRGQVASLQGNQKRIENDVLVEISDRSHLYKELASLKVSRKAIVDKVVSLEMAMRNFRTSIRKLAIEGPKGRLVTNILNRQVAALRSLKKLRDTQVEIQNGLIKYKLTMMKTHEDLLERDRKRVLNEVALRKLQSKLLEVYRKMETSASTSVSSQEMLQLLKQQKDTLMKMSLIQKIQQELQKEVLKFRQTKNEELNRLEEDRKQHQRDLQQLEEVKRQTINLYEMLQTKLKKEDESGRLEDITKTQDNLVKTLSDYKSTLAKTQNELQAQRLRQAQEASSTSQLRQELRDLHRTLSSVVGEPNEQSIVADTEDSN